MPEYVAIFQPAISNPVELRWTWVKSHQAVAIDIIVAIQVELQGATDTATHPHSLPNRSRPRYQPSRLARRSVVVG